MVCFVILHYMVLEETILCVDSIINIEGPKKIIIVDNASPNGTYTDLYEKYLCFNDVIVIRNDKNSGFAKGNNFGYKYAVEHYSPEFVVVMNNDMEIKQKNFIEGIKESYKVHKYYIMGPDIYSTKKKYHQNPQTRKIPSKRELKRRYIILYLKDKLHFLISLKWWIKELRGKEKNIQEEKQYSKNWVDTVVINPLLHGSCYVFSELFISKYQDKCFYEETFMYMEAEILYYLAVRQNEKIIYYPEIAVIHHEDMATDAEFKNKNMKSIFTVKCLLQSCKVFLDLMDECEKNKLV